MITAPVIYPQTQAATASSAASSYGNASSFYTSATLPLTSGSYEDSTTSSSESFIDRIVSFASDVAQTVYDSVVGFFSSMFDDSSSSSSRALDALSNGMIDYASTKTTKTKTFVDKIIAWFKSLGDLGTNVSKGIKAGREVLGGITDALGSVFGSSGSTSSTAGISSIGAGITSAAKAVWDWLS